MFIVISLLIISILIITFLFILVIDKNKNICIDLLTDEEYLSHMIKHHEVAVYMSEEHLNTSRNPLILNILRNIIRIQNYEINTMKDMMGDSLLNDKLSLYDEMSSNVDGMNKLYYSSQGDFTKPNLLEISNTFCDPSFFNIAHSDNLHNMTDATYIQHMMPHHQVAVDMSKKILKTTNNDFIIYLAYRIIRSQQLELTNLYYLTKSKNMFESNIL